jgi:hypothetical protein
MTGVLTVNANTNDHFSILDEKGNAFPAVVQPLSSGGSLNPVTDAIVYVSKAGSDVTGDGSSGKPFLTIAAAMAIILDASPTKRYAVSVHPGRYTEAFALKPNVQVVGVQNLLCQIRGAVSLDPTWSAAGDNRSGFKNILFGTVAQTFNFNLVSGNEGKLVFESCTFNTLLTVSSFSGINQIDARLCNFLGGYDQTGFVGIFSNCLFQNAGLINITARAGQFTIFACYAGDTDGNVVCTAAAGNTTFFELGSFSLLGGSLTLDGADIISTASPGCLPASLFLVNGAPSPRPDITGSRAANAALTNLLAGLASAGVVTDSTTA